MPPVNPSLLASFDANQTNTATPPVNQQTDGYQTNEIPLSEHHGFMFNQYYSWLNYLKTVGISQWDVAISYPQYSRTMRNGIIYESLSDANVGNDPLSSPTFWKNSNDGFLTVDNLIHIQDQKTTGTSGGASGTTTIHTRTLNTILSNTIAGASLATNQITLPIGDYYIEAKAPAYKTDRNRAILYNVTDVANELIGQSQLTGNGDTVVTQANINGLFSIATSKVFELRHYTNVADANGLGIATNDTNIEIYSEVKIWRVK